VKTGNAAFDLADELAERERLAGIARASAAVKGMSGRFVCDCGSEIPPARRAAYPNAKDCIDCATFAERMRRRRA
jgi:phage/conjugal plasmid C-4 type zinc finger TraR family protein